MAWLLRTILALGARQESPVGRSSSVNPNNHGSVARVRRPFAAVLPLLWACGLWAACGNPPNSGVSDAGLRADAWVGPPGCTSGLDFADISQLSPDLAANPFGGEAGWDHVDKYGPGLGLADLDGDGHLDLVQVRSERNAPALRTPVVYRGLGDGRFEEATRPEWRDADNGTFALLFDYDGDEDLDLLIGIAGANVRLYRNDGAFAFVDATVEAGLEGIADYAYAAAAGDVDSDGVLDLYLGQWQADLPEHGAGMAPNRLLLGTGTGFALASAEVACEGRSTLGLDIYVANDFFEDCLYENLGDGEWRDVAQAAGVATDAMHAMGVAFGDLNGDAHLDVLVTDTEQTDTSRGNAAFVSSPTELSFESSALSLGLDGISTLQADWLVCWGVGIQDFDLDGYPDIHLATHIERDEIYLHNQAWEFAPAWNLINGIEGVDARGTAYGDIDGDGDLDIVQGLRGAGIQVLRNTAAESSQFLRVEITPPAQAIGASVWVVSEGKTQIQVIQAGSGYMSSGPPTATFGLCGASSAQRVEIRFADGSRQVAEDVAAGVFSVRR